MITIRALLNRIRWDRKYGRGEFTIGYFIPGIPAARRLCRE
jgi:MJ1316 RNA cyclic group end recognition domain